MIEKPIVSFQVTSQRSIAQIGYVDEASYEGPFIAYKETVPSKNSWWTLNLGDVQYNGQSIKSSNYRYAIIDTGARMIFMAYPDYANFVDQLLSDADVKANIDCSGQFCASKTKSCEFF